MVIIMSKNKVFLPHNERNIEDWEREEARLRKISVRAIILVIIATGLFALILCDIFGAFGEGSLFIKLITAFTTFVALLKGVFDLFQIYIKMKHGRDNHKDDE